MSIGIYSLSFNNYASIYIGQSVNIELRVGKHLSLLKHNKHYNYKLSNMYSTYGDPTIDIIELCNIKDLNVKENEWIQEFDSYNTGLNLRTVELTANKGPQHPQAKFTKEQIIEAFEFLLDPSNLIKDINEITGVSRGMISMIACGQSHRWLEEEYPEKYAVLTSLIGQRRVFGQSAAGKGVEYPTLVDPEGNEFSNIHNVKEFAKAHQLGYSQLSKVLNRFKGAVSVKGWKLKQ